MKKEKKAVRQKKRPSFDESHALRPMVFATVIVNDGQASSIGKMILAKDRKLLNQCNSLGGFLEPLLLS